MSFNNKHIIITGGASGIGLEIARQVLEQGGSVALFDRSEQSLAGARKTLARHGARVLALAADCADSQAVPDATAQAVARFGRIDGLVANAGIRMKSQPLLDLSDDTWDNIIRVNLRSVFVTCKAVAPHLIEAKGGSIVTMSSISGKVARIDQTGYCASKAGAIQFSRALALELAQHNVRVNAICPGTVRTPMFEQAQSQDGSVERDRIYGSTTRFRAGIPLRRIAESDDVAGLALYLLSDVSRHVTGQAIMVDGGESLV